MRGVLSVFIVNILVGMLCVFQDFVYCVGS